MSARARATIHSWALTVAGSSWGCSVGVHSNESSLQHMDTMGPRVACLGSGVIMVQACNCMIGLLAGSVIRVTWEVITRDEEEDEWVREEMLGIE